MFKNNFGRCQSLWQVASTGTFTKGPWNQSLSSSSVNADSVGREEDAFGLLSSDPSSEFYERGKNKRDNKYERGSSKFRYNNYEGGNHKRYDNYVPNSTGLASSEQQTTSPSAAFEVHRTFQQGRALERWQKLKNADDERMLQLSRNLVQDDVEGEYIQYFSSDPAIKRTDFDKRGSGSKGSSNIDHSLDKLTGAQPPSDDESFGTLSPPKNQYEYVEGDEGDKRQEKFEEAMLQRRHTPTYYGNQMKKLCRERRLLDAIKILEEEMPSVAVKPNDYCYQVLINACGRAGYTKKAFQLYNQMKKRGLEVQPVAYTGLFNACAHSPWLTTDGLQRAHKLREQLKEKGYIFNQTISHVMIKAFGRCGDIKTAFQIVDEMLEQGLLVTTETINFMLQACITDQETGFRYALLVWRKMRELRLVPNIYSYNLLVRCVSTSKAGDPMLTTQLLEASSKTSKNTKRSYKKENTVKTSDLGVNDVEVTDLKNDSVRSLENEFDKRSEGTSQGESNQLEVIEVNHRLEEMRKTASNVDAQLEMFPNFLGIRITTGCVIGLSSLSEPEDRLALLGGPAGLIKQMERDRVKPDLRTVTQLIDSLPSNNEAEESLLQSMKNTGLTPDTQFCNMLIRKRCFRNDFVSAKDVLDVMQEHHLFPDLITFGCLALGCKTLQSASELLSDMDTAGFKPNLEIMRILVKNSIKTHNHFFALEMLREMRNRSITPDDDLVLFLEDARLKARKTLMKMESSNIDDKKGKKTMECLKLFLLEYKNWLKKSEMQPRDHPWAQYQFSKANA